MQSGPSQRKAGRWRRWIRGLLMIGAFWSEGRTQSEPAPLVLTFSVFARHQEAGLAFLTGAGGATQDVVFYGQARSPLYRYQGGQELCFYESTELSAWRQKVTGGGTRAEAEPLPTPVGRVVIPSGVKRALLLFIPTTGPTGGVRKFTILAVDDGQERLPRNTIAVINVAGRDYRARLGEREFAVPQGVSESVPLSGTSELQVATLEGGEWRFAASHRVTLSERGRAYLVFFPPRSRTGIYPIIRTLVEEAAADARPGGADRR